MRSSKRVDVCVVGGGSGGFGAAVSAARHGARTLLVEASPDLGGTSTRAGVNNYEPVAGATGLPAELYERLRGIPDAVSIQVRTAAYHPDRPWGIYDRSDHTDYRLSLSRRSGTAIVFEPEAMNRVMRDTIEEAGCERLQPGRFTQVAGSGSRLEAIDVETPDGTVRVESDVFVDATADIHLARAAECESAIGVEPRSAYDEPSAPDVPEQVLNNASLCYRITPTPDGKPAEVEPPPVGIDLDAINPVTSIRTYPNGDRNMNPLHLMTGREAFDLGEGAYDESLARIRAHWHVLQTRYAFEFARWRMTWISPALGVRETHRLVGEHVLTEHDVETPLADSPHDDVVAFADHALDFHGARPSRQLVNGPYGIPFRCLVAKEYHNLLVACRGASFSSIAASSCRLSRTLMVLGQAAGIVAARWGQNVSRFDPADLRERLRTDGVALSLEEGYLDAMPDVTPIHEPAW